MNRFSRKRKPRLNPIAEYRQFQTIIGQALKIQLRLGYLSAGTLQRVGKSGI